MEEFAGVCRKGAGWHSGGGGIGGDWYSGGGGIGAGWHSGGGVVLWVILLQDFEGALVVHTFGSGGSTPAHTCIRLCTMSKMSNSMTQTHTCVRITLGYTRVCVCMCVCFALSVRCVCHMYSCCKFVKKCVYVRARGGARTRAILPSSASSARQAAQAHVSSWTC